MRRWSQYLQDNAVAIFLFHGVVEESNYRVRNYTGKNILAREFTSIIDDLCLLGTPISMDDVADVVGGRQAMRPRSFAITFDDGFENNLSVAHPILQNRGVPATIYVTTSFVDQNGMSWIDRIEWVFETASRGRLTLPWGPMFHLEGSESKIVALKEIRSHVKSNSQIDVDAFVSDVFRQLHVEEIRSSDDPLDRKLTWDEVKICRNLDITIGGHSHTHATLSFLSADRLEWEIAMSSRLLEERAGIRTRHYSYPEGLAHCFSKDVIEALKTHGYECCPTAIMGANPVGTDPFLLNRILVA
jgi:peptidoglycan/xylan/chitin deacetylase (PgdA/CDA1 family)